jgi:hypothetical protein
MVARISCPIWGLVAKLRFTARQCTPILAKTCYNLAGYTR